MKRQDRWPTTGLWPRATHRGDPMARDIVIMLEIHQPLRIKPLIDLPPGSEPRDPMELFEWSYNRQVFERVAENVYIKASKIILESLRRVEGFKITFSISGIALELMRSWAPKALRVIQDIASTGKAEFMAQTYYHSLAWLIDPREFEEQVMEHSRLVEEILGYRPTAAENTEFMFNNDIACTLHRLGFKVVVTEGVEWIPGFRGYNHLYTSALCPIGVLVRNYRLSDDIGFRFSMRSWDQYPLTADKYSLWLDASPGDLVFIAMDYETFGEHHRPETGIYEFLRWLPIEAVKRGLRFLTVSEASQIHRPVGSLDIPPWATISWADERDLSAWLGNEAQKAALERLRILYSYARAIEGEAMRLWRLFSTSDHFYYQATKQGPAGDVHSYFNPYGSPYKAQLIYHIALSMLSKHLADLARRDYCGFVKRFRAPDRMCYYMRSRDSVWRACSLEELLDAMERAPRDIVDRHVVEGYIDRWLRGVLLAERGLEDVKKTCYGGGNM